MRKNEKRTNYISSRIGTLVSVQHEEQASLQRSSMFNSKEALSNVGTKKCFFDELQISTFCFVKAS